MAIRTTQAMGAAMTKISTTNRATNGMSATSTAVEPQNTLRTVSTSRNSTCQ